eukprot:TRINITY_DN3839_c4_g1_i2.p1 TRINITY_DN3839_c4_g1~~TRINITY_DN3839_c4_g1_i2.p1  ORF type:complete len:1930 (-),score=376.88 TRINITY_DN3839_c4_g1_i2:62-5851(-)
MQQGRQPPSFTPGVGRGAPGGVAGRGRGIGAVGSTPPSSPLIGKQPAGSQSPGPGVPKVSVEPAAGAAGSRQPPPPAGPPPSQQQQPQHPPHQPQQPQHPPPPAGSPPATNKPASPQQQPPPPAGPPPSTDTPLSASTPNARISPRNGPAQQQPVGGSARLGIMPPKYSVPQSNKPAAAASSPALSPPTPGSPSSPGHRSVPIPQGGVAPRSPRLGGALSVGGGGGAEGEKGAWKSEADVQSQMDTMKTKKKKKKKSGSDIEDYETRLASKDVVKDKECKEIMFFPVSDIDTERVSRTIKTEANPVNDEVMVRGLEGYVKDELDVVTRDWTIVRRACAKYDGHTILDKKEAVKELGKQESITIGDGGGFDAELIKPPSPDGRKKESTLRNEERIPLLSALVMRDKAEAALADVVRPAPDIASAFPVKRGLEFLIHAKELSFPLGEIEPFFCSLVLMDISKKQRISEAFHFDLNSEPLKKLLATSERGLIGPSDPLMNTPYAVFSVVTPSPSIYLVLQIDKVLTGDPDAAMDPYFKHSNLKQKERAKLLKDTEFATSRLGKYTMPVAWTAIKMFSDEGKLEVSGEIRFRDLCRARADHSDERLYFYINKREKHAQAVKRPLPGYCKIHLTMLKKDEELPGRIDTSLYRVLPTGTPLIREIEYLGDENVQPNITYTNHLYVYLENANLTKGKGSSRNISVRVQLRDQDGAVVGPGLPLVYGRSDCACFATFSDSACTYHNKKPVFYHEVKIELPSRMTDRHHLFFTFLHLTVKPGKKDLELPVGYAFAPVFASGKIVKDGHKCIPIAASLPEAYLNPNMEEEINWLDNMKPLFDFTTKTVSSVFTQDEKIHSFFSHFSSEKDDTDMCLSTEALVQASDSEIVRNFPVLLDQLLHCITNRSNNTATAAFFVIPHILNKVDSLTSPAGSRQRNPHLVAYVNLLNREYGNDKRPLYNELVRHWLRAFNGKRKRGDIAKFSWFFFDIIFKSMILFLEDKKLLENTGTRKERLVPGFYDEITDLIAQLHNWIKSYHKDAGAAVLKAGEEEVTPGNAARVINPPDNLNAAIAHFLKDLLSLADPTPIFKIIGDYIGQLCPANDSSPLVSYKFEALRIICDHEHYVPLNIPTAEVITDVLTITEEFWRRHFLSGLLLDEVCATLRSKKAVRVEAIRTLRNLLRKHDADIRYATSSIFMKRIAALYFPYILGLLEHLSTIQEMDDDEKRDWLVCFAWVVRNQDSKNLLRKWWKKDTFKSISAFFRLIGATVTSFPARTPQDSALRKELGLSFLGIAEEFMQDFSTPLFDEKSDHMSLLSGLLMILFQIDDSVSLKVCLLSTVRYFVFTFKKVLFRWRNTSFCGDLTYEVLRHCNMANHLVSGKAAALFYLLIKMNFSETKTFSRIRLQSTIAISRLTGTVKENELVKKTLQGVVQFAQRDSPGVVHKAVDEICNKLASVIMDSQKMSLHTHDPEMTADLYYQVSTSYSDSPDLRVAWLDNLCNYHIEHNRMEEAAQCKIYVAALIAEFLIKQLGGSVDGFPPTYSAFSSVSPSITKEKGLPDVPLDLGEEEGMYNPKNFSEQGYRNTLKQVIAISRSGLLFEQAMDVYNLLTTMSHKQKDYVMLARHFSEMKHICDDVMRASNLGSRMFGNRYRVAFFGKAWGDQHGREYIYRESDTTRTADITNRLLAQFKTHYGAKVEVISNLQVNMASLKPDIHYFQVVSVTEHLAPEVAKDRKTLWDKKFNVDRFIFESPFTASGKAQASDIREQRKRKTILYTERPFPFVLPRLPVVRKEEIIMEPLEVSIELVQGRIAALRKELDSRPPSTKTLQQVLQGSVLVQVNAGPSEIAKVFLGNASAYPAEQIQQLKEDMIEFVSVCQYALVFNKSLIGQDQEEFQHHLEQGFGVLRTELNKFIPNIRPPGVSGSVIAPTQPQHRGV